MGKWDAASAIINEARTKFIEQDRLFHKYGLGETYDSLHGLMDGIEQQQVPGNVASYMALAYRDWAPMAFWNRHKEVYTMHPGLTTELDATGIDDTIPGHVLRHLPHPDPLFVFPTGIGITLSDGKPGRVVAVQVSGAEITGPGRAIITSTTNKTADGLYLSVITEVLDETGAIVDWDYCHTSIPITDSFTIASLINTIREYVSFDERFGITKGLPDQESLGYVQRVTGIALAHVLYVVSRGAQVAPPRNTSAAKSGKSQRSPGPASRPIKHRPVGYVIGAALDAARQRADRTGPATADGSRTVRPHMRRAHFHTVRYGKGRANAYVEWFPPIPVKITGPADKPTLHAY